MKPCRPRSLTAARGPVLGRRGARRARTASGGARGAARPPNLLLVTIDTLRADHVGAYGYAAARDADPRPAGPRGRPASRTRSSRFPRPAPRTRRSSPAATPTSTASATTSRPRSTPATPTLATPAPEQGYDTGAFIGAYPVSRASGLDRGFDVFDDPFARPRATASTASAAPAPAGPVVDAAARLAPAAAAPGPSSPGSTSSTRTRPTSRRRPTRERFRGAPLRRRGRLRRRAARPPPGLAGPRRARRTDPGGRDRPTTARASASTARTSTCSSSTTRRCTSRSSCRGRAGCRPDAGSRGSSAASTCCRRCSSSSGSPPSHERRWPRRGARAGRAHPRQRVLRREPLRPAPLRLGAAARAARRGLEATSTPRRAELYRLAEDPGETRNLLDDRGQVASAMRDRPARPGPGGSGCRRGLGRIPSAGRAAGRARLRGRGLLRGDPLGDRPQGRGRGVPGFPPRDLARDRALRGGRLRGGRAECFSASRTPTERRTAGWSRGGPSPCPPTSAERSSSSGVSGKPSSPSRPRSA